MKKPHMAGSPVSISIEPTTSCNLRCPQCISGTRTFTRPTGMMDLDDFKGVISQLRRKLVNLTLYFQGEPFLHPAFFEMVGYAGKNRIYTMTSTNGHYLTRGNAAKVIIAGLDRIIISVDSFNQETYSAYRVGGNIETVISGIGNLVNVRKEMNATRPLIILQFLVFRANEDQIEQLRNTAYRMGADKVDFKTMQIYDYANGSSFIPGNKKYSRYIQNQSGTYEVKADYYNHCWKMWHSCVITWDTRVVPCCFDKDASHAMGNLRELGEFKRIWMNETYREFRSRILNSRKSIDICSNCTEGTSYWV
ncbi:MAG TPA: radical SAM/SPASM domain-containing protein [Cyclobacteriaceae bacterium]|nr:radical SAM/SPASM domain-containing protein [Cyclobacteriaceae bacterium]